MCSPLPVSFPSSLRGMPLLRVVLVGQRASLGSKGASFSLLVLDGRGGEHVRPPFDRWAYGPRTLNPDQVFKGRVWSESKVRLPPWQ